MCESSLAIHLMLHALLYAIVCDKAKLDNGI